MRQLLCAVVLLFAPLRIAYAAPVQPVQSPAASASFSGTVVDATAAPIGGATIRVITQSGQTAAFVRSDRLGAFELRLTPGLYSIRIEAPGFAVLSENIQARTGGVDVREFILRVASVRDTVTVVAPSGYSTPAIRTATKTPTPLIDVPQAVTVVTRDLMQDQLVGSLADVATYVPGAASHQGENNRDEIILRGNNSSANFFVDGVRDDVQYYRDLYNTERVEIVKGPNALIFGRGGAGGVVNRVMKAAEPGSFKHFVLEGGSFDLGRVSADVNKAISSTLAFRLNGVYQHSDSFRSHVGLERFGVTPSLAWSPSPHTKVSLSYEHLYDRRTADRGVSSFHGRPLDIEPSVYFGDPANSRVWADVDLTQATIEHQAGRVTVRNHTLFGAYDRGYQNFVPGAVSADRTQVTLTAYNNATRRLNVFNQTDLTYRVSTGAIQHTILAGVEAGRQVSDNFRNTGFFGGTATSTLVPLDAPTVTLPIEFRQSATDADNHVRTVVGAAYAQDQVTLSRTVQAVAGLRIDHFGLNYHNNRSNTTLARPDTLVSPRAGLIVKPAHNASIYGSYSVSYLPSSGDQFSSLTTVTEQVKPEKFTNYEVGVKWDMRSRLSLTTDVYRLDRTNTRSTDPNDPTRIVQTGSQRTNGFEVGLNGHVTAAWTVAGGYAFQSAHVTSATTAAPLGATVAQVPRHTASLWNRYQVTRRAAVALGIVARAEMFARIDDAVTLPGYARADVAGFWTVSRSSRLQVNVENLFNTRYFLNADSNTNISPGSPRAVRVALTMTF